jgi:hypothetical protein
MSYLDRVRELHKELSLARDSVARVEILDRMLFVIEAQSRAWKLQHSSLDLAAPLGVGSSPDGGTESSQPRGGVQADATETYRLTHFTPRYSIR